jgi:large subunit ribosomal protein L19
VNFPSNYDNKILQMDAIKFVQEQLLKKTAFPAFRAGDSIELILQIKEGDKTRTQSFKGDVISISGEGAAKMFTVRKISNGVGVERIFPFASPNIEEIKVLKRGRVRRAKLYYLRGLVGRKARIKELRTVIKPAVAAAAQ